ncbi:MAG: hypothetical protein ACR2HM_06400, partial [Acidimicrobiales bacterium]
TPLAGRWGLRGDEVGTTGATVAAASWGLRGAGAAEVHAVAAARTPPGRRHVDFPMAETRSSSWT